MLNAVLFSAIATNEKIDAANGIIYGVSVITIGEAAGKNAGTWIDQTTLSQIHSVASTFKDGVKVKMSMAREHDGSVGQIVGVLKNFRTVGSHERADLHLLKADSNFAKIIEMSATMPNEFGFSVVIPKHTEKVDGKDCLRCDDIYSIDLVEEPAANPSGLFSTQYTTMSIKYAKGDSGEHAKDCECKECMSAKEKHSKLTMLGIPLMRLAAQFGLPETTTEEEVGVKILERLSAKPTLPPDLTELTAKITDAQAKLAALTADAEKAALSAKRTEISTLVQEASAAGKVVPLTNEELEAMPIATIKTMLSKIQTSLKTPGKRNLPASPTGSDGKPMNFNNPAERISFCQQKQAEGAAKLTADFAAAGLITLN